MNGVLRNPPLRPGTELGSDGELIGRDPRTMATHELITLGHRQMNPLKALRLRCVDCCCGSLDEVRKCVAVSCPAWPFRMGRNPWRKPASDAQRENARRRASERALQRLNARPLREQNANSDVPATTLPGNPPSKNSQANTGGAR